MKRMQSCLLGLAGRWRDQNALFLYTYNTVRITKKTMYNICLPAGLTVRVE
jgi:hypothetical protein